MPRRACGTEMKSGPPSSSPPPLRFTVARTGARSHFSSLSFVKFSFWPPSSRLPSPPHPCSLFLRPNNSLWPFLLFHWFCYVYLLLHLWNWRHRPTSLLLFNNRSWAFSLALGYQWCQTENVTSHQFEKAGSLLYCCCVLYWRRNFSHLGRKDWKSTTGLIFNEKNNVICSTVDLFPNRS